MRKCHLSFLVLLFVFACSQKQKPTTESIIEKAIENYGGEPVYNSSISFSFREKKYKANYQDNNYQLERSFKDSLGVYKDILTNNNFTRTLNDSSITLTKEWIDKYSNSINSVIYFFRIPFHLKDKAVNKKLIDENTIKKQTYYKIKVWFNQDGGGEDFSDVFIYWVNKTNYNIDYFAYSYETNGGGKRFREMTNPRRINNLLVTDYINYEPKDTSIPIENFETYFEENGMKELSRIKNTDVIVEYN